jgi:hypothetical protein
MNKKTKEEIAEERRRKAWEAEIGDPRGLRGDDCDLEF